MTPADLLKLSLDTDPHKKSGIYMIYSIKNNKCYIGQSKSMKNRFSRHKSMLKTKTHSNIHLQNAWNLHGSDFFSFHVLELVEKGRLLDREKHYYNLMDKEYCYNLHEPAAYTEEHAEKISKSNKGRKLSPEHVEALRIFNKGKAPSEECIKRAKEVNTGKKQTKETIEKRMAKIRGRKHSEESKQHFSAGQKKVWEGDEERRKAVSLVHKGKKLSEETKKKIGEAGKNRIVSDKTRAKLRENIKSRRDPNTGRIISKAT